MSVHLSPSARRLLTLVLFGAAAGVYLWLYVGLVVPWLAVGMGDFVVYLRAGRAVLDGASPYTVVSWIYPPLLAYLISPLAALPYSTAAWLWFALQHLCLAFAALWTWLALRERPGSTAAVVVAWVGAGSIAPLLREGQISSLLLALLCLVLWPPRRLPRLAGVALGVAAAIKIWPGLLWAADALSARWRRLGWSLAWGAALTAIPALVVATTTPGPLRPVQTNWNGTPAFLNFSLPGVALRLLDPLTPGATLPSNWVNGNVAEGLHLTPAHARIGVAVSLATIAAGLLLVLLRSRRPGASQEPAQLSATLISLALLGSPVCWPHYEVMQLPGAALLVTIFLRRRRWTALLLLIVAMAVVQWTEAWVMGPYVAAYGAVARSSLTTWTLTTAPALAMLVIVGLHLDELGRPRPEPGA